ncbi:hypothetical protein GGF40_001264 [Coemansia sp. RSA 1286]|nr:hypothetical protein GGF39_001138 [Coemansia sp. RSA 1721]KAJ2638933.1 hypothetical protein GGF40_001264 [Coemansia sp. RSA 1286]
MPRRLAAAQADSAHANPTRSAQTAAMNLEKIKMIKKTLWIKKNAPPSIPILTTLTMSVTIDTTKTAGLPGWWYSPAASKA